MYKSIIFLFCSLVLFSTGTAFGIQIPELKGYVNDYAGLLTKDESAKISRDLELYESSTSNQIYILTVPNLQGEDMPTFSIKVAEAWKAGQKGKDNGVIITIAKAERKVRIEVGKGLEGSLTDLVCGRITREDLAPKLKDWKTAAALEAAIPHIMLAVKGEFKGDSNNPKTAAQKKAEENVGKAVVAILIFGICVFLTALFHIMLSTLAGGLSAPVLGFYLYGANLIFIIILALLGAFIGYAVYHLIRAVAYGGDSDGFFGGFFGGDGGGSDGFSGGGGDFGGGGGGGDF